MKARVLNQASAGVWLYLPQPDANMMEAVRAAAEKCGAGAGMFGPDSAGMRVADILSRADVLPQTEGVLLPEEPVLLMDGFDRAGLDRLLAALREGFAASGLPGIALKAIVTPTNRSWRFDQLVAELKKEHEMMQRKR